MNKSFWFLFFLILLTTSSIAIAKDDVSDVKSTQGIELQETDAKTLYKIPKRNKEDSYRYKMLKSYNKKLNKIKRLNLKKEQKTQNIEFLKHRLEIKEQRLEDLTSEGIKKGEQE